MTEKNPPVWLQAGSYNAVDDRLVIGLLSERKRGPKGTDAGILGGIVPGWDQFKVTAGGNDMTVSIGTGLAVIPSKSSTPAGAYIVYNNGTKLFTLDIASTTQPRIDLIYAEVEDQTSGGSESKWRLDVRKGNPAASPVTPPPAAGELEIAAVRVVPASQNGSVNKIMSSQIINLRRQLTGLGDIHHTKTGTPNPPHAPGRFVYNETSNTLYVSNGTTWDKFLTYTQWMNVFKAMRPKHSSGNVACTFPSGDKYYNKWDATPAKYGSSGAITPVRVTHQSPSGMFKVSISARGHASTGTGSGHLSVRVIADSKTNLDPSTGYRGLGFFHTDWEHHGTTFLISGRTPGKNYTFQLEFIKGGDKNTVAVFDDYYLLVEPVL